MPRISGTNDDDRIIGTPQRDQITARAGDDVVFAFQGRDTIDGGSGRDDLAGQDGDDVLFGGGGPDNDDRDILRGGPGDDRLLGGNGDDIVSGGFNQDVLIGGAGRDQFVTHVVHGFSGRDTITDAQAGETLVVQRAFTLGDEVTVEGPRAGEDANTLHVLQTAGLRNYGERELFVIRSAESLTAAVIDDGQGNAIIRLAAGGGTPPVTDPAPPVTDPTPPVTNPTSPGTEPDITPMASAATEVGRASADRALTVEDLFSPIGDRAIPSGSATHAPSTSPDLGGLLVSDFDTPTLVG